MTTNRYATITTYAILSLAGAGSFMMPGSLPTVQAFAASSDTIYLTGAIRDFSSSHPDFGITDTGQMGHYVNNVASVLHTDGRPIYSGGGHEVLVQWKDKNGNPIMPYGDTDSGLPGGHFDVDVYNKATNKELWHKHKFDDAYDVTYIDIANDPKLLFRKTIPLTYPNNLRVVFFNAGNGGGGTYTFQAGGSLITGTTALGFTQVFNPKLLTKLRVNFLSLGMLKSSEPKTSQSDVANRNGAFAVRMYDTVNNALKYEVVVYNHGSAIPPPPPPVVNDRCGAPITDTFGLYGDNGTSGITSLASFDSWFHDTLDPTYGTNQSSAHIIALKKDGLGVYSHCTDNFYPIDGMLGGNEGESHNNYFTFMIHTTFVYHQCASPPQFFEFEGSDDAWVFINGKLVMDLGGAATPSKQYVALDRVANDLGLVNGQTYPLDFFYAQRRNAPDSKFCMRTNLNLAGGLPVSISGTFD